MVFTKCLRRKAEMDTKQNTVKLFDQHYVHMSRKDITIAFSLVTAISHGLAFFTFPSFSLFSRV